MRASLDANTIISFLLKPASQTPPVQIVLDGIRNRYQLCLTEGLLREVEESVRHKRYLSEHIGIPLLEDTLNLLRLSAEVMQDIQNTPSHQVRDPKDDYLVAHAIAARVDYLVTGDKDLLVLGRVGNTLIVTPADFLALLDTASEQ